jgi:hypothetical protein
MNSKAGASKNSSYHCTGRKKKEDFKKPTNNQVAEWLVKSCAKLPLMP